jgi:hypothetical protein
LGRQQRHDDLPEESDPVLVEVFPEGLLHGGLFLLLSEQVIEDA